MTPLTDRPALERARARSMRAATPARFLHDAAIDELGERLESVNKSFMHPLIVAGFPETWQDAVANAKVTRDTETLEVEAGAHDLVLHGLSLHWANDPVGQLVQCRRALRPDGLFLCALFGGQTLYELRTSLTEAEAEVTGGLSPRVAPMAEIRDLGGLLQRAGFALPVADSATFAVVYRDMFHLMHDLRAMGETNALQARVRHPTRRSVFMTAAERYARTFAVEGGGIRATFEIITLTGWAPDESQQKPLRPGSAAISLADALRNFDTKENDPD